MEKRRCVRSEFHAGSYELHVSQVRQLDLITSSPEFETYIPASGWFTMYFCIVPVDQDHQPEDLFPAKSGRRCTESYLNNSL